MSDNPAASIQLINEVLNSVRDLGVDGTIVALQNARSGTITLSNESVDFTLKMVSNHFKYIVEDIVNSRIKSTGKKLAVGFVVYYLHNTFGFSLGDLQPVLKRHKSQLSRLNAWIKGRIEKKSEGLVSVKTKFDLEVSTFCLKNKKQ